MMCFYCVDMFGLCFLYFACCADITTKICSTVLIKASIGLVNVCFVIVIYAQKSACFVKRVVVLLVTAHFSCEAEEVIMCDYV